jgi:hypothetical protein
MTSPAASRLPLLAGFAAALLVAGFAWAADPVPPQPTKPSVSTHATVRPGPPRMTQPTRVESRPTWNELNPAQRQALEPLAASWGRLGEAHKRKWLAVSSNFPNLPPAEQARLHSRMAEWAALSPQQRTQARLNFAETQAVPADDKRAKWEAYQALPPEEKRKLAAGAGKPVPPTAAAVRPVPKQKLVTNARAKQPGNHTARLAVIPAQIDQNTLLPQPGTLPKSP